MALIERLMGDDDGFTVINPMESPARISVLESSGLIAIKTIPAGGKVKVLY